MIIPLFTLFILSSVVWLIIGIQGRKYTCLLLLNLYWWLGSFASAYFVWLAWQGRGYSENWSVIGFVFFSLPYLVLTGLMIGAELFFIRKWQKNNISQKDNIRMIRLTSLILLIFLIFQMAVGFLSA